MYVYIYTNIVQLSRKIIICMYVIIYSCIYLYNPYIMFAWNPVNMYMNAIAPYIHCIYDHILCVAMVPIPIRGTLALKCQSRTWIPAMATSQDLR